MLMNSNLESGHRDCYIFLGLLTKKAYISFKDDEGTGFVSFLDRDTKGLHWFLPFQEGNMLGYQWALQADCKKGTLPLDNSNKDSLQKVLWLLQEKREK